MEIFRKMNIKSKAALILSGIALFVATINLFVPNEIRRTTVWVIVILVWVLDYMIILQQHEKMCKKLKVAQYEIENIKWSYRGMGRYIENLPELEDIDTRISNELAGNSNSTKFNSIKCIGNSYLFYKRRVEE